MWANNAASDPSEDGVKVLGEQSELACPACKRVMDVHPYYGPGCVVVDTCGGCHLIWLDHGEIGVIQRAPGVGNSQ